MTIPQRIRGRVGGWLGRHPGTIRWSRTLAYAGIAASGVAAILKPPTSVEDAAPSLVVSVWALLLAVSAAICAVGSAMDRWVGEYIGLVPLGTTAMVFSLSVLGRGWPGAAGGAFLFGVFWLLASRWQEVALLRTESTRHAKELSDDGGGE